MTDLTMRDHVTGWRWDLMCPDGWIKSDGATYHLRDIDEGTPLGWFTEESATCLRYYGAMVALRHKAPAPACACGLHAVEHLSAEVAELLADFARWRGGERALGVALSRVELFQVLPSAWPDPSAAIAAGGVPDPPHTVRAARKVYTHIYVDRGWLAIEATRHLPGVKVTYVRNLSQFAKGLAR